MFFYLFNNGQTVCPWLGPTLTYFFLYCIVPYVVSGEMMMISSFLFVCWRPSVFLLFLPYVQWKREGRKGKLRKHPGLLLTSHTKLTCCCHTRRQRRREEQIDSERLLYKIIIREAVTVWRMTKVFFAFELIWQLMSFFVCEVSVYMAVPPYVCKR